MQQYLGTEILDVTLRDGGYANGFSYSVSSAVHIVSGLSRAGIRMIEVGYFDPSREASNGTQPTKCCGTEYLRAVRAAVPDECNLFVMVDPRRVSTSEYARLAELGVNGVRLVSSPARVKEVPAHVVATRRANMLCSVNLTRVSEHELEALVDAARFAGESGADWVYLADSNGSMFPERTRALISAVAAATDARLGFHAHDSLSLAFANSLAALDGGATLLDGTLAGFGKGAGNLRTELVTAYFKAVHSAQFDVVDLTRLAADSLRTWLAPGRLRSVECVFAALLDINIDEYAVVEQNALSAKRELVVELERLVDIGGKTKLAAAGVPKA